MIKLTPEEQAYWDKKYDEFVREKIREAEEDIKVNGTLTEEEFWEDMKKFDEQLRRENQLRRKNIKLHIPETLGKISKKFIRV